MKVEDVKCKGESAKFKVESLKFRVEMRMVSKVESLKLKCGCYCHVTAFLAMTISSRLF